MRYNWKAPASVIGGFIGMLGVAAAVATWVWARIVVFTILGLWLLLLLVGLGVEDD